VTQQNLAMLRWPVYFKNVDYKAGLETISSTRDQLVVVFIAPPWGNALDIASGLDLGRTKPPIAEIVDFLTHRFQQTSLLCAVQVFEHTQSASLSEVQRRFDWSSLRKYKLNASGHNNGLLLGTRGWAPSDGLK